MKIVFLDIDGVLTTISTKWKTFHPDCVKALKRVIETTNAKVVLSSTWRRGFIRYGKDGKGLNLVDSKDAIPVMKELFEECGLPAEALIDKTPFTIKDHRGTEIDMWLKQHPEVESFVILDDDDDLEPHLNRHVLTNWGDGMSEVEADKAISLLTETGK